MQDAAGAVVAFDHVTKRYGGPETPPAVTDLTLTVPAGEIVVLVGPSGCGKTTTMKMVNRLIEPTGGRITIGDQDVMSFSAVELRRRIGYVIQQVGLFPHLTIGENVAVVPSRSGSSRRPSATDTRASSRAASASAWAWRGPSRPIRRSCSWTSRSGPSTRSVANGSRTSSCASSRSCGRR
jgi:ABC-type multidrug transport system ATPase subunit